MKDLGSKEKMLSRKKLPDPKRLWESFKVCKSSNERERKRQAQSNSNHGQDL